MLLEKLTRRQIGLAAIAAGAGNLARDAYGQTNGGAPANAAATLSKITVEKRDHVLLIGLNRPEQGNRVDPEMFQLLSKAYFAYEEDQELRSLVLFGHGSSFCQGIDVEAFADVIRSRADETMPPGAIDPWSKIGPRRTKPVVVAAHGDTFNIGHELFLAADIRVAASNTRFANTENISARMPASGATIRFVREAGWGQAMRYLLTGDAFSADEAYRLGTVQEIGSSPADAFTRALDLANKIAACAPLSIKATLASAHMAIDEGEPKAISQLIPQRRALYGTNDFKEGLLAGKERRRPIYHGD